MILKINDRIRNRRVEFFNNFQLDLVYDSVGDSFSLSFYFDPENLEHKELACIGHYHICTLEHNDEILLTGYILSENFSDSPVREMVGFSGYSLPGVLEDCEIPTELYPLQSDNLSLKEIAEKIIKPFGLRMVIDPAVAEKMDKVFEKSTAKEGQNIKSYLAELAAQKNIVLSHTAGGALLFTEAKTNRRPILNFDYRDGIPFTSMVLGFNGQPMHSHITIMKQADSDGGNAGEHTIRNPFVPFVYRPKVIVQSSGDDNDTEKAAMNALAAELKNLTLTIKMDTWEVNGTLIKPNNIISVYNPKVYLYKRTNWFIEKVTFIGDNKSKTAILTCVIPEVYNGKMPTYLFDNINLH